MQEQEAIGPAAMRAAMERDGVSNGDALQSAYDEAYSDDGSSNAAFAPLTASLLARKGEAQPAHEPYSKARVAEGAREMPPGARHNIDEDKQKGVANADRNLSAKRPGSASLDEAFGPVVTEGTGEYTSNPFQFAASQGLKDIIERDTVVEADLPFAKNQIREPQSKPSHRAGTETNPSKTSRPAASSTELSEAQLAPESTLVYPSPAMEAPEMREAVENDGAVERPEAKAEPPNAGACQRRAAATGKVSPPRKAAVTFRMSTRDFLRMKLASAELEMSCQDLLLSALEEYLDALGVERLDQCQCLARAAGACDAAAAKAP